MPCVTLALALGTATHSYDHPTGVEGCCVLVAWTDAVPTPKKVLSPKHEILNVVVHAWLAVR